MSKFKLNIGMKQMVFCSSSPIDEFYTETTVCSKSPETEVTIHCNPLVVLLNQKRLDKLGQMGLEQWLSQFDLKSSSDLDKLRSQCSDEDLLATIKSRHLQAPAEILSWSRYMANNMDEFNTQVKSALEAQKLEQESKDKPDIVNQNPSV